MDRMDRLEMDPIDLVLHLGKFRKGYPQTTLKKEKQGERGIAKRGRF